MFLSANYLESTELLFNGNAHLNDIFLNRADTIKTIVNLCTADRTISDMSLQDIASCEADN
eukprot:gene26276-32831_t